LAQAILAQAADPVFARLAHVIIVTSTWWMQ